MISDEIKSQVNETREKYRVGGNGGTPHTSGNGNDTGHNNGSKPMEDQKEDKENKTFTANSNDTFNANQQPKDFTSNQEEPIPEEDKWLYLTPPTQERPKKNKDDQTAKVEGNFNDEDGDAADTDPLKIQEGDIIDYMMKEIILASANWAGGWAAGWVGYVGYRVGSKIYHGPMKKIGDTMVDGYHYFQQDYAKLKQGMKNALNKSREEVGNKPEDFEIKDGDDKTTIVNKNALRFRYQNTHVDTGLNEEVMTNLTKYALEGKLDRIHPDQVKKIPPMVWASFRSLEAQERQNPHGYSSLSDDKKKERLDQAVTMTTGALLSAKLMEQFVSSYAAAMVINDQQKGLTHSDKSPKELKAYFDHYRDDARKIVLLEFKKINAGKEGQTLDSLVELSTEALKEQQHNMEKDLYKEKGKEPKTSAFSKLEKLRSGKNLENQNIPQLMSEVFQRQTLGGNGASLQTKLKESEETFRFYEHKQGENDAKRQRIEQFKQQVLGIGNHNNQNKTTYQGPIIAQKQGQGR